LRERRRDIEVLKSPNTDERCEKGAEEDIEGPTSIWRLYEIAGDVLLR
jgi:hypothetical protein